MPKHVILIEIELSVFVSVAPAILQTDKGGIIILELYAGCFVVQNLLDIGNAMQTISSKQRPQTFFLFLFGDRCFELANHQPSNSSLA